MANLPTEGYTEIQYGNSGSEVIISNCTTLKFHQENVVRALDQQMVRYTIRVSGYFLAQTTASTQITPNGAGNGGYQQTAGTQHIGLRQRLQTPRLPFKYTTGVGGLNPTIVVQANPVEAYDDDIDGTFDVNGGPVPRDVSITHIVGNTAFKVEIEFEVCLSNDCVRPAYPADVQRSRGILSNKWTCADDIDENYYIRSRTFVGEMKLANPVTNPHDFRALVVPAISPGMRLKSMDFKCSEDCLSLQYTVRHEEVTATAPYPATSIKITHKVHIAEMAVEVAETLTVSMCGDRDVNKQDLVALGYNIANGKIRQNVLVPNGISNTNRLRHVEVIDESGTSQDNRIHMVFHMTHTVPDQIDAALKIAAMPGIVQRLGKKIDGVMLPGYDNTLSRGNRAGENPEYTGPITVVGAFAAHLQSVCAEDHSMNVAVAGSEEADPALIASISPELELPSVTLGIYPELIDLPNETWNTAHTEDGIYSSYQIDSHYSEQKMIMQIPVSAATFTGTPAAPSSSSAVDGDTSAFVRLGPSQWTRVIRIVAQRHAIPPRLADPLDSFRDDDDVLNVLCGPPQHVILSEPQRSASGDNLRDYVIRTEYTYGLSKAPSMLRVGIPDTDAISADPFADGGMYAFTRATLFSSDHPIG